jgi:biopolymer transport protein ExbB
VVLGLFSVVALTIGFERIFNLKRSKIIPPTFESGLQNLVGRTEADVNEYRQLSALPSPIANVLSSAVKRAGRPLPEVEKAMEDTVAREMATLRGKHRALSVIGNVAPLVGLLGTVVGIIFAFKTASVEGVGKGEALSEGISLALMTTAVGLTVAIPSLILVAWFNAKSERYMRDVDLLLLDTLPTFSRWEHQEVSEYAVNQPQRAEETFGAS